MKKKCLFTYLFVLFLSLFLWSNKVDASNSIYGIAMDIYLDKSGNAHVTEVWNAYLSEGTEGYKPYYNLGTSEIKDFKVTMDGKNFEPLSSWNTSASFNTKAYHSGLHSISNGIELCWGISTYGTHKYTLTYTITNFVSSLQDADMAYWTLIPYELSSKPRNVEIKIHADEVFEDTLDVWGYGNYGGLAYVSDGAIYMSSDGELDSNEYMTLLVKFPKGIFEPENQLSHDFQYYLDMANEGAKAYKPSVWERIFGIFMMILPVLIFVGVFGVIIILSIKESGCKRIGTKKLYFGKKSNLPSEPQYFRDIPCNKQIDKAYWIARAYNLTKKQTDVMGSYLLDWINKDYITVEKKVKNGVFKDKEEQHLILKPLKDISLEGQPAKLYDMLVTASKDGILEPKEFSKWCEKNYEKVFDWFDNLLDDVSDELEKEGHFPEITYKKLWMNISNQTIDDTIYNDAKEMKGLRNFLKDFSNIKDRSSIEVKLWQEYLIYAQIFGIAKQVAKEFKRLYPEVITDTSYDTIIFVHTISYTSMNSAQSARSRAQSYSSGGGGFSSGGGGGGSFGGGGGGGGFR